MTADDLSSGCWPVYALKAKIGRLSPSVQTRLSCLPLSSWTETGCCRVSMARKGVHSLTIWRQLSVYVCVYVCVCVCVCARPYWVGLESHCLESCVLNKQPLNWLESGYNYILINVTLRTCNVSINDPSQMPQISRPCSGLCYAQECYSCLFYWWMHIWLPFRIFGSYSLYMYIRFQRCVHLLSIWKKQTTIQSLFYHTFPFCHLTTSQVCFMTHCIDCFLLVNHFNLE